MFTGISKRIEGIWDAAEAYAQNHRRKSIALGALVVSLPQWWPSAKAFFGDSVAGILSVDLSGFDWRLPALSPWNWLTIPLGLLLIWRSVQKRQKEIGGVRFDHEWERPHAEELAKQSNDHGTGREITERVRATQIGFYDNVRRREGDVFTLSKASHFSAKWMERVAPDTPEKVTTSAQALRRVEAGLRGRNPEEAEAMRIQDLERALAHSRHEELSQGWEATFYGGKENLVFDLKNVGLPRRIGLTTCFVTAPNESITAASDGPFAVQFDRSVFFNYPRDFGARALTSTPGLYRVRWETRLSPSDSPTVLNDATFQVSIATPDNQRVEAVKRIIRAGAAYERSGDMSPETGDGGFARVRLDEFLLKALRAGLYNDTTGVQRDLIRKDMPATESREAFARHLDDLADRLTAEQIDATYDPPPSFADLLKPR